MFMVRKVLMCSLLSQSQRCPLLLLKPLELLCPYSPWNPPQPSSSTDSALYQGTFRPPEHDHGIGSDTRDLGAVEMQACGNSLPLGCALGQLVNQGTIVMSLDQCTSASYRNKILITFWGQHSAYKRELFLSPP